MVATGKPTYRLPIRRIRLIPVPSPNPTRLLHRNNQDHTQVCGLAFAETTDSLDDMRERLNEQFQFLGLRSVPSNESTFIYDEVVFRWLAQGRTIFDRSTFHEACRNEGLLEPGRPAPLIFGVKSFEHPTDVMEDRFVRVLNLLPAFYDRQIRPESDWQIDIYPRLKSFLLESAKPHEHLRLALDAHFTLAVAAGTVLNVKSGRSLEIEQRTNGRRVWAPDDQERVADWSGWESRVSELETQGEDLVVAVGLTNDPLPMVSAYLSQAKLPAHLQLFATPTSGPGAASVRRGRHAVELAEQLVETGLLDCALPVASPEQSIYFSPCRMASRSSSANDSPGWGGSFFMSLTLKGLNWCLLLSLPSTSSSRRISLECLRLSVDFLHITSRQSLARSDANIASCEVDLIGERGIQ